MAYAMLPDTDRVKLMMYLESIIRFDTYDLQLFCRNECIDVHDALEYVDLMAVTESNQQLCEA